MNTLAAITQVGGLDSPNRLEISSIEVLADSIENVMVFTIPDGQSIFDAIDAARCASMTGKEV